jgi:hypothetical protein
MLARRPDASEQPAPDALGCGTVMASAAKEQRSPAPIIADRILVEDADIRAGDSA